MDLSSILGLLGDDGVEKMANQAGLDKNQATSALAGALPTILSALKGNSQSKLGQKQLSNALERDHDGSLLDNLSGFFDNPQAANGKGILKHTLGSRRTTVEGMLSEKAGVSSGSMSKILEMAAPLVMSYLGRQKKQNNVQSNGIGDLIGGLLGGNDSNDGGFDIGDIASMFINNKKGGIAGFLGGLLGR
ncbi:MAG: DUF937 domain-containing protein [Flavobacteriales bacterium]